jgi:hypothetical protein
VNNPIECYFKIIKLHYLLEQVVMPSVLISILYKRILSKFYLHYNAQNLAFKALSSITKNDDLSYLHEVWRKGPLKRKHKGYYMQECRNYAQVDESSFEVFENNIELFNLVTDFYQVFLSLITQYRLFPALSNSKLFKVFSFDTLKI